MTFNEYMDFTKTTAIYPENRAMDYLVSGLTSEAGEVAGKYKKIIRDKDGVIDVMDAYKLAQEIGDVMWYCARLSDTIGWDLQDIVELNVEKLTDRQDREVLTGSGDDR